MPGGFAGNEGMVTEQPPSMAQSALDMGKWYATRSSAYTASTMMKGWSGKGSGLGTMFMQETFGIKPDVILARKLSGGTWFNDKYTRMNMMMNPRYGAAVAGGDSAQIMASRTGLAKFAPSLSHLSPARHGFMAYAAMGGDLTGVLSSLSGAKGTSIASIMGVTESLTPEFFGAETRGSVRYFDPTASRAGNLRAALRGNPSPWSGQDDKALREIAEYTSLHAAENMNLIQGASDDLMKAYAGRDSARAVRAWQTMAGQFGYGVGEGAAGIDRFGNKLITKGIGYTAGKSWGHAFAKTGSTALRAAPKLLAAADIAMWALLAVDVGKFAGKKALWAGGVAMEDFRRGSFMTSSVSSFVGATERQRALQVMQQTGMNLQSVLGNEASYFG